MQRFLNELRPKKGNEQLDELGFVENLIKLWKLRGRIAEAKSEMLGSGTLAKYIYKAGEAIMNKSMDYRSSYAYVQAVQSQK